MTNYSTTPMKDAEGFLKPEAVMKIIKTGETTRDRLLMETLWVTGARVSEIVGKKICQKCGQPAHHDTGQKDPPRCQCDEPDYYHENALIPERIRADENVLVLYTLKRGVDSAKRFVSVPEGYMDRLVDYASRKDLGDRIFPITQERVYQIVRESGKRAGIEKVGGKYMHPHIFRHSHAVQYIQGEHSIEGLRKLQKRFKHASIDTTSHYLQFAIGEEEKEKIEEKFGSDIV